MQIRCGTLAEVEQVVQDIDEFVQKETVGSLSQRLDGVRHLVLVAEDDGRLLGFKIGYETDATTFYSWFGGVSSQHRGRGIAQQLLEAQEQWLRDHGYRTVKVKSRNQFPAMLCLLVKNGYIIENYEKRDDLLESRIHFIKNISN